MAEFGIDLRREGLLEAFDFFGDVAEPVGMASGIAAAFVVGDDSEPLAEGGGEGGQRFVHREKLETGRGLAQASVMSEAAAKKILIVDDDVALMRVMRETLTSFLRCEVDTSPKPEYGFELALKKTYDLMLFDFSMPMIDGAMLFFLIGKVYNNSVPPRIVPPLLLVTAKGDEKRAQDLLQEAGVRGLIPKPFAINRLIEKVKECLPGIETIGS